MILMTIINLLLFLVALSSSSTATNFEQFGFKLYSTVSQNKKNENIFLSPASISLAMSMCTIGAQQETLNQMLKTFEVSSRKELIKTAEQIMYIFSIANQDKQIQLKLANRLYAQKTYQLQEEYLKIIQNSFQADIKLEDFENQRTQAVQRINAWVEQQTNNLIRNLLSIEDVTSKTRLIIINSIYFKGTWIKEFNKNLTNENANFYEANGKISKVALMHQREKYAYVENNNLRVQIVHIPYKSENKDVEFVFTIILPNREIQLDIVEQKLASQPNLIQKLLSHQNTRIEELHLYLPKFKMETTFALNNILQQLGMKDAFNSSVANFTGIASEKNNTDRLYISKVIHKAFIDVNEQGSEAAAVTAVIVTHHAPSLPPPQPIEFKADRPFLFFIRESRQNIVLFSGRFISPPTNS
ncbi:unnamed protein product [Rotaria sordida]|uniref:Serpin domain-containing protein n=1 Tax=Rotaria sordida TaxID=392033 RepID=A0A815EC17_9BILA|nr:unnamed protein product [Rotaria sordida]CAF4027978.1 unnamed protein product [Rotaria sordida]